MELAGAQFYFEDFQNCIYYFPTSSFENESASFILSYVYRSAKFDAKFYNFLLACLFYFTFGPKSFIHR